jgi:hypothetical protein
VLNESSVRRTLKSYFAYYHGARTHLSLEKDAPETRPVQPPELGSVVELPEVADCITVTSGGRLKELFSHCRGVSPDLEASGISR